MQLDTPIWIRPTKRGEVCLGFGLAGVVFSAFVMPVVLIGLLVLVGAPLAIIFQLVALFLMRDRSAGVSQQLGGLVCLLAGLGVLWPVAYRGSDLCWATRQAVVCG